MLSLCTYVRQPSCERTSNHFDLIKVIRFTVWEKIEECKTSQCRKTCIALLTQMQCNVGGKLRTEKVPIFAPISVEMWYDFCATFPQTTSSIFWNFFQFYNWSTPSHRSKGENHNSFNYANYHMAVKNCESKQVYFECDARRLISIHIVPFPGFLLNDAFYVLLQPRRKNSFCALQRCN
jgi:hypothetical protein